MSKFKVKQTVPNREDVVASYDMIAINGRYKANLRITIRRKNKP